jgi:hypothetical protein
MQPTTHSEEEQAGLRLDGRALFAFGYVGNICGNDHLMMDVSRLQLN